MKAGRNQQVVMRLIDAISQLDGDRMRSFFNHNSFVQTLAHGALVGGECICDSILQAFSGADAVDCFFESLVEDACGAVCAAGKLRFLVNGQWREYAVNGIFEVRGCKIAGWREGAQSSLH